MSRRTYLEFPVVQYYNAAQHSDQHSYTSVYVQYSELTLSSTWQTPVTTNHY